MKGLKSGRVVYYVLPLSERGHNGDAACAPAIVTRVWDTSEVVNLRVLPDGPETWWRTAIEFDDTEYRANTWHWMFEEQETRYGLDRVELDPVTAVE